MQEGDADTVGHEVARGVGFVQGGVGHALGMLGHSADEGLDDLGVGITCCQHPRSPAEGDGGCVNLNPRHEGDVLRNRHVEGDVRVEANLLCLPGLNLGGDVEHATVDDLDDPRGARLSFRVHVGENREEALVDFVPNEVGRDGSRHAA